ncbi:hypothetical protein ACK35P_11260 [Aeromonas veronii]|uniref:hypothetical protein n=1 Tax=Aeromonas veronii TaxID=654 RepID=UPI0024439DC2|nr:hypothetical protein [Aeromonas veronii]
MNSDWKDSKPIIAVSTSVATALFIITIYSTVVIPVYEEKHSYKFDLVSEDIAAIDKLKSKLKFLERENQDIKAENFNLKVQLKHYQGNNPFKNNSVFPIGLSEIKPGMDISKIQKIFPINNIEQQDDWVVLSLDDNIFDSLTIYTDRNKAGILQANGMFLFFYKKAGKETAREIVSLLKHEFSEINITEELRNDIYSAKINNINGYDVEVSEFRLMVKFPSK